ncbi:MAG: hypothetical protein HYV06_08960 [Deltaproteobacteria bacterium]|nr:hypothetical protein [Deltaproteobacteria bacterium]
MPTIRTLSGRNSFSYTGNCKEGFYLEYSDRPFVSPQVISSITSFFCGTTVIGGFNVSNPKGFGKWLQENTSFTSRHGSHIAAVLAHEDLLVPSWDGNRILLHFR